MPEAEQTIEGNRIKNLEKMSERPWLLMALDVQEHAVAVTIEDSGLNGSEEKGDTGH